MSPMAADDPSPLSPASAQWLFKSLEQSSTDCQGDKIQACLLQRHVLPCPALFCLGCCLLVANYQNVVLKSARCDTLTLWFGSRASWYRQGSQPGHFTAGEMLLKILITLVLIVQPVFLNENVLRKKLIRRKKHFSHEEKINENENPFFPGKQMIFVSFNNIFL